MSADTEPVRLEVGRPVVRDLAGGASHSYLVRVEAGQYVRLTAEQRKIDVELLLRAPDGSLIRKVDSPNGNQGPETTSIVAEIAGDYQAEVISSSAKARPGQYEIRIDNLRTATPDDRTSVEAERIYHEGEALRRDKKWQNAQAKYEQALAHWRSLKDLKGEALALDRIGQMLERQGELDRALELYDQAIAAYRAAGDLRGEASVFNRRGGVFGIQERSRKAQEAYEKALEIFRQAGDLHGQATALNNLGTLHDYGGRTGQAVEAYEAAAALSRQIEDFKNLARIRHNVGLLYIQQGKRPEARDALEEARRFAEAEELNDILVTSLSRLGYLDQLEGRLTEASKALEHALAVQRELKDEAGQAMTHTHLGETFLKAGDLERSWKENEAALALFRKLGDRQSEGVVLSNLGRVHHARKEDWKALEKQRQAQVLLEQLDDPNGMAMTRYGVAQSLVRLEKIEEARAELEECLRLVEDLRAEGPGLDFRASYFASKQHYWDLYIETVMRLHERNPHGGFDQLALQASERRRARSLLDALALSREKAESERDSPQAAEIRETQDRLNQAMARREAILASGDDAALGPVEADIRTLSNHLDVLRTRMHERSPGMAEFSRPVPLKVEEIQRKILDASTLLLVYSLGEERSFLWTVSQDSVNSHVLAKREKIEATARQLTDLLPQASRKAQTAGERAARSLSDLVLESAADEIYGYRRLLVVGDGALQKIPFTVLPDPALAPESGERHPLLVENHELVHLPSASTLGLLMQREGRRRKPLEKARFAVIADPVFGPDDERVRKGGSPQTATALPSDLTRSVRSLGIQKLERLAYTQQEGETILAMVKKSEKLSAFGFEATRELFLGNKLSDYHFIHIATHSLLNDSQPELSGIALSMVDPNGAPRDGFLRLHEIYNLKLNASLVVLSACDTGGGKELRGEGLLGITRAFLNAGARRLVVSLWKVEDRSTAELMKRFYHQYLEVGKPPAEALQRAQLSMLQDPKWSHPRHWAGFIFQGDFRRKPGDGIEEQDSGGTVVVKKAISDLPPPKVEPPVRRGPGKGKPARGAGIREEARQEALGLENEPWLRLAAYHPARVVPGAWSSLLAYFGSLEAEARIEEDSQRRLRAAGGDYLRTEGGASRRVAKGQEITIVPELRGCRFNPPFARLEWLEDFHCAEFRMQWAQEPLPRGQDAVGSVSYYVGPILIGEAPLRVSTAKTSKSKPELVRASSIPYQSIFISYSRSDTALVEALEESYRALGFDPLRDVKLLKSGEPWQERLLEAIDSADIFQLFWSHAASSSKAVESEWRYALKRQQGNFIRPVYWERPMPRPPQELAHLHFHHLPLRGISPMAVKKGKRA